MVAGEKSSRNSSFKHVEGDDVVRWDQTIKSDHAESTSNPTVKHGGDSRML